MNQLERKNLMKYKLNRVEQSELLKQSILKQEFERRLN